MTSTLTQVTLDGVRYNLYHPNALAVAGIATALLIALLITQEVMRVQSEARARVWVPTLRVAIAPLLIAFAYMIALRFIVLLSS